MSFVLDTSVTIRWFFGDGKPSEMAFAAKVLDALATDVAIVPVTWGLEVANVIARAEAKALVTEARSGEFLELLDGLMIEADAATFTRRGRASFSSRAATTCLPMTPPTWNYLFAAACPSRRSMRTCRKRRGRRGSSGFVDFSVLPRKFPE